jgi:TRAP-type C4-dicarboxylate transport system substrate-binding protein
MFVTMNKGKWEKLPAEVQKIFADVSDEWVARHGQAWGCSATGTGAARGTRPEP